MIKYFISIVSIIFFSSCTSTIYKAEDIINPKNGTNFSMMSNKLTVDICPKLTSYSAVKDTYITDFVNTSSLENSSQLGFLLSNQIQASILSACDGNMKIKELAIGKNIKIGKQGVKILSRDVSNLKKKTISQNSIIIIGIYSITSEKLITYIKVVDLDSGNILYSRSAATNITDEILELEGIDTANKIYTPLVL